MSAEAKLKELGIVLPEFPKPVGNMFRLFRSANCCTSLATARAALEVTPLLEKLVRS